MSSRQQSDRGDSSCHDHGDNGGKRKRARHARNFAASTPSNEDMPAELEGMLRWPRKVCEGLERISPTLTSELAQSIRNGFVLTTAYSGMGCAEAAAAMLCNHVLPSAAADDPHDEASPCALDALPIGDDTEALTEGLTVHAACDTCPHSMYAMKSHKPGSRPSHFFTDVLHRVAQQDRAELLEIQRKYMQYGKDSEKRLTQAYTSRGLQPPTVAIKAAHTSLGIEMRDEMREVLDHICFEEFLWCDIHHAYCPWIPRSDFRLRDKLWCEAAGTTCVAWAGMGAHTGWLHPSTLPCLCWAYSLRFAEPDMIAHECVPAFQAEELLKIINSRRVGGHRFHYGRQLAPPRYRMQSCVFSPHTFGFPTERRRRYSMFVLGGVVEFLPDIDFFGAFERECDLDGLDVSALLCAPAALREAHVAERIAVKHDLQPGDVSEPGGFLDPVLAYTGGEWIRRGGFMRLAEKQGLLHSAEGQDLASASWECRAAVVDLSQTSSHRTTLATWHMPCLQRNSGLADLVSGRLVLVEELCLSLGFAHPQLVCASLAAELFPYTELHLAERVLKGLLGNTMHLQCIGSCMAYLLACTKKSLRACL